MNMTRQEKKKFITKVTIAHVVTYFICGLIFSTLFNYKELFQIDVVKDYMKDAYSTASMIGPVMQVLRGIIFGFLFLLIKDSIWGKPKGWLKLWLIIAGIGIICTPDPCPASIEGLVYTKIPLEMHLKGSPEVFTQTLLFSIWVTAPEKKFAISEKLKKPMIVTMISGIGFSLSGIILALALNADVMQSASDPFAFVVMGIALVIVFFLTKWYVNHKSAAAAFVYYLVCYLSLAGLPTAYNYITGSMLRSPLSLIFSGLPLIPIAVYMIISSKKVTENAALASEA